MKLSSTTFLRISALILVAVGAYGIYSWQMKEPKVEVVAAQPGHWPWYYYAFPLALLIIFGWVILAKHPFKSPGTRLLAMLALFAGVAYFGVKTFDSLPKHLWSRQPSGVSYQPPPAPISSQPSSRSAPVAAPVEVPRPARPEPEPEPSRRSYSYEECWQIARRAYSDDSVAVPPDCQQAWGDYKRRQEEIADAKRWQEEEAQDARERAERAQQEREDRERRIAEEQQRERESAARDAEYRRQERERERERKIREAAEQLRRIFKKN